MKKLPEWRNFIQNNLELFLKNDGERVLDIGYGETNEIVKSAKPNMKILDQRTDLGKEVIVSNIELSVPGTWDLIILSEVLEHSKRPWHALKNCVDALDNGGRIFISVPVFLDWHPMMPVCGDYWRFMPGSLKVLAEGMPVKFIREAVFKDEFTVGQICIFEKLDLIRHENQKNSS